MRTSSVELERVTQSVATDLTETSSIDTRSVAVNPGSSFKERLMGIVGNLAAMAVGVAVVVLIVAGFALKGREIFVPGEGVAYKFGIIGGSTMLLLLFYPVVKRVTWLGFQRHGGVWLQLHMFLGILGPLLIFYHANFSFGALNSNLALLSMIAVSGSGVIGRYIYTRVHRGMSAVKFDLGNLLADSSRTMLAIEASMGGNGGVLTKDMAKFAKTVLPQSAGMVSAFAALVKIPIQSRAARSQLVREANKQIHVNAKVENWSWIEQTRRKSKVKREIVTFLNSVSKAAQLTFWERIFSLWHLFHVPLFFVLLVSGVIHVVAVHLY
jgi:hypothetical protein